MDHHLLKLILAFEHETADMLHEFLQRAGLNSPFDWREAGLARKGYIRGRPRIVYRFHGAGLRLRMAHAELILTSVMTAALVASTNGGFGSSPTSIQNSSQSFKINKLTKQRFRKRVRPAKLANRF